MAASVAASRSPRPACDQCRACVSVRVVANEFRPSRNFKKVLARNADIVGEQLSLIHI